jgi:hypothetical protein
VCRSSADDGGGWFNYSPLSDEPPAGLVVDDHGSDLVLALLAIVFIAVWAGLSIWLFGLPHSGSDKQSILRAPDSD